MLWETEQKKNKNKYEKRERFVDSLCDAFVFSK